MESISVDRIEEAIREFYHTNDGRERAHKWLSSIQNSPSAWEFCWQLISKDKSQEVQFFGATTLQLKVLKHWFEVPNGKADELRTKVMEKVLLFGVSPQDRLIANKLCLAMAGLMMHMLVEEWPTAISEVTATFQNFTDIPQEVRCRLLLDIFTGLADQYKAANFGVNSARTADVHHKLMEGFDEIHTVLSALLEEAVPHAVQDSALRCMSSWIEFGVRIDKMGVLVNKAFKCLHNENLFESAVDTLIAALTKNQPSRFSNTLQNYFSEILHLLPLWTAALHEENLDWCRDISRLVVNFAEENVDVLIQYAAGNEQQRKLCMDVIQMILALTDVKGNFPTDETLSDLPFGFWYILQDVILASTEDLFDFYMTVFTPVYISLAHVLIRKVQYPDEVVYRAMSGEEKEQFRCYRQDISDTVMYANCLLKENLLTLLNSYIDKLTQALPNVKWQDVECVLYIVSNIPEESMSATEDEWDASEGTFTKGDKSMFEEMTERLVHLISMLQLNNEMLLTTVLQVIGAFSEHYVGKPHLLSVVFPVILLHGLQSENTILFATRALKDTCKDNMTVLSSYSDGILSICQTKISSGQMTPRNAARLISCVGYVLSGLGNDQIGEWLNKLLPPITQSLEVAAAAAPTPSVKSNILNELQMLTWLFDSLDPKRPDCKPVLVIIKSLLPLLNTILSNWVSDSNIVECIVELLKKSLNSLLDDFKEIIRDVCHLLIKIYECIQHPVILDIIKQLVLMFNKDAITFDLVKNTFYSVAHNTLQALKQEARNRTDLLESYMNLCSQMSKKLSIIIADEAFPFEASLEMAIVGVSFPEAPTMKASCSFLAEILAKKEKYKKLDDVIERLSAPLYHIMLKSIGGASPRANVENTTAIFLAMNVSYLDTASKMMTTLLSQENYPVPQPTPTQKSQFIKDVLRERSNKRRLKDTIANFSMVCRGIYGTEYAQQVALSNQFR
ncbi:importin-13-like [Watersipora subatra]|uniref:importin-13-like n=1 Tax=Watersipora subatra TaxID=2589382 RepID=UPI00355B1C0F